MNVSFADSDVKTLDLSLPIIPECPKDKTMCDYYIIPKIFYVR